MEEEETTQSLVNRLLFAKSQAEEDSIIIELKKRGELTDE